jgi:hypothetical protein
LVELQERAPEFEQNGIRICAISYDTVEVLRDFARKHTITYPLLADTDSAVIRRFGIFNTHIPQDHDWYGVPFPGIVMTDAEGFVIERSFYASHGLRDAVGRTLHDVFHVNDVSKGVVREARADRVRASAYLSSKIVRPSQVLTFTVDIEVDKGSHIYGRPLPENYLPTTLTFQEVEDVHFGQVQYPEPQLHHLRGLGETLPIYDGRIELKASIRNSRREGFTVRARLQYQACDEEVCYLPEQIDFELPLDYSGYVSS